MDSDLEWQSIKYRDGTTYEGLARSNGKNHDRGVLVHPNGDRYEGEFRENQYHGFGAYVWTNKGAIYRGQFKDGRIKGCGVRAIRQPDGGFEEEAGFFVDDEFIGPILGCPVRIAQAMATEADLAASMSRVFQLNPPGTNGSGGKGTGPSAPPKKMSPFGWLSAGLSRLPFGRGELGRRSGSGPQKDEGNRRTHGSQLLD